MKTTVKALEKEHQESEEMDQSFEKNPAKRAIQELFSGPFHGNAYKRYSLAQIKDRVVEALDKAIEDPKIMIYKATATRLLAKVKKIKDSNELLLVLNEYLFT